MTDGNLGANMIELQIINKVLQDKSIDLLMLNDITSEYFVEHKVELEFILEHYTKYNNAPDKETFFEKFPDFNSIIVTESDKYLVDTMNEVNLYQKATPIINEVVRLANINANDSIQYLIASVPELTKNLIIEGFDVMKQADSRLNQFNETTQNIETGIIKTQLPELDDLLFGGWKTGEELVTLIARTNQGKSWLMELFGASAWLQNKRVAFYSGEMSPNIVGYRLDTLIRNFSNTGLMTGKGIALDEYTEYINTLKTSPHPFAVVTRKELGGKATVAKLAAVVDKYEADILIVDQYSLMHDSRQSKNSQKRDTLGHITDDLMELSIKYKIPVIGAAQANREANKKKNDDDKGCCPELEHISDSDQIGHNSSRVISMRQVGNGVELCKRKDRYFGRIDETLCWNWNIDIGKFIYVPSTSDTEYRKRVQPVDSEDSSSVF